MFPEERSPLVVVATRTGLASSWPHVEFLAVGSVWVVAVAADELAFLQGMGGELQGVRSHLAVAGGADPVLPGLRTYGIGLGVYPVTVCTGHVPLLVRAPGPTRALVVLVAGKTHAVLKVGQGVPHSTEVKDRIALDAIGQDLSAVLAGRAMAGFALQSRWRLGVAVHPEGGPGYRGMAVDRLEHGKGRKRFGLVVAAEASVGTSTGVVAGTEFLDQSIMDALAGPRGGANEREQRCNAGETGERESPAFSA